MRNSKILMLLSVIILSGCSGLSDIFSNRRSASEIWRDNTIEFEVSALGNKEPYIGDVRVYARAYKGDVILFGQAETNDFRDSIESYTRGIPAVISMLNVIKIKPPLSFAERNNDTWLATKIKTAFLRELELDSDKIMIVVEDQEVFLFGYISRRQGKIATESARNVEGVKEVILGFKYTN